jgi:hypothetical protein
VGPMRWGLPILAVALLLAVPRCSGRASEAGPGDGSEDAGQGSSFADGGDAGVAALDGGGDGGPFVTAPHLPLPTLSFHNGTAFTHPQLVTVTWTGFAFETDARAFGDGVVSSQWLGAVGGEYGVTGATHLSKVALSPALPSMLTDAQLRAVLDARIADGTLPSPGSNPQLLLLVYIPSGVVVDASAITRSGSLCGAYYGYHFFSADGGTRYAYAVSGDCDGQISSITALASHELIEAALDPFNDGYYLDPPIDDDWHFFRTAENADLCQAMPTVTEFGYTLERGWSNAAVSAGQAPCLPIPSAEVPYSDVSPPQRQILAVDAGTSVDVSLTGWAVASRVAWPVTVSDSPLADFATNPQLSASVMNNGTQATLTLTVPVGTPPGKLGSAVVYSGSTNGRYWPVTIMSR